MKKNMIIQLIFPIVIASQLYGATLTIDVNTIVNPSISPLVFGVNAGVYDGPYDTTWNTLASNIRDAGIKSIRWPGGGVSDTYDWYRAFWEGGSGPWYSGAATVTIKAFCDMAGADLYETANMGMNFPPANGFQYDADTYWQTYPYGIFPTSPPVGWYFAQQWVNYCNVDCGTSYTGANPPHPPFNIKYWEIGNEPSMGYCTVNQYCQYFRQYVTNMKKIDPTIKVAGPSLANLDPNNRSANSNWLGVFLNQCGDLVDVLCVHWYPGWNTYPVWTTELPNISYWDTKYFPQINSWIQQYVVNKWGRSATNVKIAVTEWAPTSGQHPATPTDMGQMIWMADVLGTFIKNNVYLSHYWAVQNATDLPIYNSAPGFSKNTGHYAYKFMSTHLKKVLLNSTSDDANLDAYCSRYSNFISLLVVNKSAGANIASTINLNTGVKAQAVVYMVTNTMGGAVVSNFNTAGATFNWTFKKYSLTCFKLTYNSNWEYVPASTPHLVSPLNGSSVPSSTPLLVWTKSTDASGITNYTVAISSSPSFTTIQQTLVVSKPTNCIANTLPAGYWYWHVKAIDRYFNDGTNSATWLFFVSPPTTPQLVTPLNASDVLTATPLFTWQHSTALSGISNYIVQVSTTPVFTSTQQSAVTKLTNYQATFLTAGNWFWRVIARDKNLNLSTNSAVRSFYVVPPTTPQLVSPLNGTSIPSSSPVLVWNSSVTWSSISNYTVEVSSSAVFSSIQKTAILKTTNYTLNSVPNGTWYWRVRAMDKNLNLSTNSTVWSFTLTAPLPSTPLQISPPNISMVMSSTPLFIWTKSTGTTAISNYTLEISSSVAFAGDQQIGITRLTNYIATPLANGTWYWRVTAMDKNQNFGTNSPGWSFTIIAPPPSTPQQISPLAGATVLSSTPLLVWKSSVSPTGISNYSIQISSSPVFISTQQTRVSRFTNCWPGSLPEGTWYWRVRSMDKNSLAGTNSTIRSFVVDNTIPIKGGTYNQAGTFKSGSQQLTNSLQAVFPNGYSTVPVNFSAFFTNTGSYGKSMNSNFIGSYEFLSSAQYSEIPVQFSLKFSPELIPAGHTESQVGLYSYNGIEWVKIEGTLDTNNNLFIFNSNKLSGEYDFFVTDPNFLTTKKKPLSPDVTQWSYNPFSPNGDGKNDVTRMELNITSPSKLTFRIYDRDRRLIRDLVSGTKVSGKTYVEWDGKDDNGKVVAPGAYIYMIKINDIQRKGVIVIVY